MSQYRRAYDFQRYPFNMAQPLQAFESSWQKEKERQELKEAREKYIQKAKAEYDRDERKKEAARQRGEGTWMLDAVSDRISRENKEIKDIKSKKKKKKKKKDKHKSKKKKKNRDDSDTGSASDSDSDAQPQWVEKQAPEKTSGPQLARQDWMVDPLKDIFGGTTRADIRSKKDKEKEEEEKRKALLAEPGQHSRELNPFWKDGGQGVPEEVSKKEKKKVDYDARAGDLGLGWLKKAYQRCVESAEAEGRTLEEVAAERYGSLKKLESMVKAAEKKATGTSEGKRDYHTSRYQEKERTWDRHSGRERDREKSDGLRGGLRGRFMKPDDSPKRKLGFMKPSSEGDSTANVPKKKFAFMKPGESDPHSSQGWRKAGHEKPSQHRWRKSDKESELRRSRSKSKERSKSHRSRSKSRSRERQRGPSPSFNESRSRSRSRERRRRHRRSRSRSSSSSRGRRSRSRSREQRKDHTSRIPVKQEGKLNEKFTKESTNRSPEESSRDRNKEASRRSRDDRSSSSDSTSDSSEPEEPESESEPEPPRLLTEDELNQLGARMIKAELMGNEEMVAKLKQEIEEARQVKAFATAAPPPTKQKKQEDKTVVLTRTDRAGNVRPMDAIYEGGSGSKKKKEKVATHGKDGQRDRYFADDDKYSLKQLVEREKMSTAEDANDMFARLAGKSVEKTDEEYDMDDMFVQRANKKMTDAKSAERERSLAISEHHRMTAATGHCKYCLENLAKHLIIAIGIKVYISLPAHRSMVPGHCLIVPMQHVLNGTSVDDDVWSEIQVFRKGLTAMFREKDEDAIFMETSMNHKRHPHMVIECIPVPRETGDMAHIFFTIFALERAEKTGLDVRVKGTEEKLTEIKGSMISAAQQALQECDTEWAQNKKVIDLSKKDVRHSVPKGFPYFSVDFGLQGGLAHVIEDERVFPGYFGREIIAGMMDIEPTLWRKPHKEEFEQQRKKVLEFAAEWKPYDWTQKLSGTKESDSD